MPMKRAGPLRQSPTLLTSPLASDHAIAPATTPPSSAPSNGTHRFMGCVVARSVHVRRRWHDLDHLHHAEVLVRQDVTVDHERTHVAHVARSHLQAGT